MKKILFLIMLAVTICTAAMAQEKADVKATDTLTRGQKIVSNTALIQTPDVEMADTMRSSGKIYVVIATIAIVFVGLAIFLFSIERRVKKLERQNNA